MALVQDNRLLNVSGAFEDKELFCLSFHGREELSRLFRFELELISDDANIDPQQIVGKQVGFSIATGENADGPRRHFNGYVSSFHASFRGVDQARTYRAEVVPWFWFLTRQTDCRIFQEKTLQEIIEKIFSDRGFSDYDIKLSGTHGMRPYTVQYNESDFNFLSRLMEEEGVWYTFKHEDGKHTMLIADSDGEYFDCEQAKVSYPSDFGSLAKEDHLRDWNHRWEFRSGKVSHADYNVLDPGGDNFLQPSQPMDTNSPTAVGFAGADQYERFEYPGGYNSKSDGKDLADVMMEEEEVPHDRVEGTSICRFFTPGAKFEVDQHRASEEEGNKYVVTGVSHRGVETMGYSSGAPAGEGYTNHFDLIPEATVFRPERLTRKPSVQGIQSAIVVGDDDIPVDEYGRVRVKFPWIRPGKSDPEDSCLIRVSQNWAGAEWGGMFHPHKGQEVIVSFLDGDPDRPVITGRVYNEEQKVPLKLPDRKTQSIIRDHGSNQIIMEGKSDEQFIHMRQACGNEMILDGQPGTEGIQLRDMYGNQIVMGAASKTISMFSPHHKSGLVLGQSKHQFSKSASLDVVGGWSTKVEMGVSNSAFVGAKCGVTLASQVDAYVGTKIAGTWANGFEYVKGATIKFSGGDSYSAVEQTQHTKAKVDILLDAQNKVAVLGGSQDAAILEASDRRARFSFKTNHNQRTPVGDPGGSLLATVLALGSPLVTLGTTALASFEDKDTRPTNPPNGTSTNPDQITKKDVVGETWKAAGSAIGGLVTGAVTAAAAAVIGKKQKAAQDANRKAIRPHRPTSTDGELLLDDKGVKLAAIQDKQSVKLTGSGVMVKSEDADLTFDAKKYLNLMAGSSIAISTPMIMIEKAKIKHKNFIVIN